MISSIVSINNIRHTETLWWFSGSLFEKIILSPAYLTNLIGNPFMPTLQGEGIVITPFNAIIHYTSYTNVNFDWLYNWIRNWINHSQIQKIAYSVSTQIFFENLYPVDIRYVLLRSNFPSMASFVPKPLDQIRASHSIYK